MQDCDPAVVDLSIKDGMVFESNGQTESDAQARGRRQRDTVYKQYYKLFFEGTRATWGDIPDDLKTEMANALGKKPLCWSPTLTARRMMNHINSTRRKLKVALQRKRDRGDDDSLVCPRMLYNVCV